jgi:hypothetical protein
MKAFRAFLLFFIAFYTCIGILIATFLTALHWLVLTDPAGFWLRTCAAWPVVLYLAWRWVE